MKHIDIFNISDFMGKLMNADGQLSEEQLRKLSDALARAKDFADNTLTNVKRARLRDSEDVRGAAIEFLRQRGVGTKIEMYNPYNQEDCVDITITKVGDGPDGHLLIEGTCKPFSEVENIGNYGSTMTVSHSRQVELSFALDDLNFTGNSTEPPFDMTIEGYRTRFCMRG